MKHFVARAAAAAALVFSLAPAGAQAPAGGGAKAASQAWSEGTIRRLDRQAGSITLSHGPIENLGMSAMTMSFGLKQGLAPAALKDGDKVRFRAEAKDGQYSVVRIEAAK